MVMFDLIFRVISPRDVIWFPHGFGGVDLFPAWRLPDADSAIARFRFILFGCDGISVGKHAWHSQTRAGLSIETRHLLPALGIPNLNRLGADA